MKLVTIIPSVLFATTLTAATTIKKKRDEGGPEQSTLACMYLTNEVNWKGEGINLCQVSGWCGNQMPDGLSGKVSSAGPEEGRTCFLYDQINCTGTQSAPIVNPGYADLRSIDFDKKAVSWRCWKWCGYMGNSTN